MTIWADHVVKIGNDIKQLTKRPENPEEHRRAVEPWLTAVFQSENLALLVGSGLTLGVCHVASVEAPDMRVVPLGCELEDSVNKSAAESAKRMGRSVPNLEDQIRAALQFIQGLRVTQDKLAEHWENAVDRVLVEFLMSVLGSERAFLASVTSGSEEGLRARTLLVSFLLSFAGRAATRERLRLFTTNYDRFIEYACDEAGLRVVDRFVGALSPIFRSSRLDVDMHYNPPGIRGEPRYLEGVIHFTKLHGSVDWSADAGRIRRVGLPFGASEQHPFVLSDPMASVVVYPNPAKDIETSEYPYADLFRDFSAAVCRPNSALVTYGYGFGDDHINRVIRDMLSIPSTHLVIISYDLASGRIPQFCSTVGRDAQISLLLGNHFGDLSTLVEFYLPKPAIEQISWRRTELLKRRGEGLEGEELGREEVAAGQEECECRP